MRTQRGFGLIEFMIGIGVSGLVIAAVMTSLSHMNREVSMANAKLASMTLNEGIRTMLSSKVNCSAAFSSTNIPNSQRTASGVVEFPHGVNLGGIGNLVPNQALVNYPIMVKSVRLTNFSSLGVLPGGGPLYAADFVVDTSAIVEESRTFRSSVAAKVSLHLNSGGDVQDCSAINIDLASVGRCPAGSWLAGFDNLGNKICDTPPPPQNPGGCQGTSCNNGSNGGAGG